MKRSLLLFLLIIIGLSCSSLSAGKKTSDSKSTETTEKEKVNEEEIVSQVLKFIDEDYYTQVDAREILVKAFAKIIDDESISLKYRIEEHVIYVNKNDKKETSISFDYNLHSYEFQSQLNTMLIILRSNAHPKEIPLTLILDNILSFLDESSRLLRMSDFMEASSPGAIGIGINKGNIINTVFTDSPAKRAGLKVNDQIIEIDKVSTEKEALRDVIKRLQGDIGSHVEVKVLRNEQVLQFTIMREKISIHPIKTREIDEITYIKIGQLSASATTEIKAILQKISAKKPVILDLRDNVGGLLSTSEEIASLFIPDKKYLFSLQYKEEKVDYFSKGGEKYHHPILILHNEGTASGSTILISALKEHLPETTTIGTKTQGTGNIQRVFDLGDGYALALTVAKIILTDENELEGISPDIEIENSGEEDLQLKKALEIAKSKK